MADIILDKGEKICFKGPSSEYTECLKYESIRELMGKPDAFPTGGLIAAITLVLLVLIVGILFTQDWRQNHKFDLEKINLEKEKLKLERDRLFAGAGK